MDQVRQMTSYVDLLKALTEAAKLATMDTRLLSAEAAEKMVSTAADAAGRMNQYCSELLTSKKEALSPDRSAKSKARKKSDPASSSQPFQVLPPSQ
jgi:hypothetical protein